MIWSSAGKDGDNSEWYHLFSVHSHFLLDITRGLGVYNGGCVLNLASDDDKTISLRRQVSTRQEGRDNFLPQRQLQKAEFFTHYLDYGREYFLRLRSLAQGCVGNACHSRIISSRGHFTRIHSQKAPIEISTYYSYHTCFSKILYTCSSSRMCSHKFASHANFSPGPSCTQSARNTYCTPYRRYVDKSYGYSNCITMDARGWFSWMPICL
jgi:hypothetical protein